MHLYNDIYGHLYNNIYGLKALIKESFPPLDINGQFNWQLANDIKVQYALPSKIYIHPEDICKVMYYDGKEWMNETIEDVKLDTETKFISFTTKRLCPFAYV